MRETVASRIIRSVVASPDSLRRLKLALAGSFAQLASTVLNFLVFFISVPLTIGYLGEERFGLWMAVASIAGMLSFMDFGVGNGLVSQVARSNSSRNLGALRDTISRGVVILTAIGCLVAIVLYTANHLFDIGAMLNMQSEQARNDSDALLLLFVALFAANIPLNGLFKIMLGLQANWIVHVAKSVGSLSSIVLVWALARAEAAPVWLLLATYGVQVAAPLLVLPWYVRRGLLHFGRNLRWRESRDEYRSMVGFGGLFLVLQLGVMAGWGADAIIISLLSSVSAVTQFAIAQRLFQFVLIPLSILNTPLWGAYADAHAHGDTTFIRRTLKASLIGTLVLASSLSVTVYLSSDLVLRLWIDDEVDISNSLLLGFAVWKVLEAMGHSFSMALNGMHVVRPQVVSVLMLCGLVLPLKFHFTPSYGATAVVWSTVVAYSLSTVLFYLVLFRRHIRLLPSNR